MVGREARQIKKSRKSYLFRFRITQQTKAHDHRMNISLSATIQPFFLWELAIEQQRWLRQNKKKFYMGEKLLNKRNIKFPLFLIPIAEQQLSLQLEWMDEKCKFVLFSCLCLPYTHNDSSDMDEERKGYCIKKLKISPPNSWEHVLCCVFSPLLYPCWHESERRAGEGVTSGWNNNNKQHKKYCESLEFLQT